MSDLMVGLGPGGNYGGQRSAGRHKYPDGPYRDAKDKRAAEGGLVYPGDPGSLSSTARSKLEKFLKVKHLRASAIPRAQALSSNQTLTQDGVSSKDHFPPSGRPARHYSPTRMNADLNIVGNDATTQLY